MGKSTEQRGGTLLYRGKGEIENAVLNTKVQGSELRLGSIVALHWLSLGGCRGRKAVLPPSG